MSKIFYFFLIFIIQVLISSETNFKVETDLSSPVEVQYSHRKLITPEQPPKPFSIFSPETQDKTLKLNFKTEDEGTLDISSSLPTVSNASLDYSLSQDNIIQLTQKITNITIGTRSQFNMVNQKNEVKVQIRPENRFSSFPIQYSFFVNLMQNSIIKQHCVPFYPNVGYIFCNKTILEKQLDPIKIVFDLNEKNVLFIDLSKMLFDAEYLGRKNQLVLGIVEDGDLKDIKAILGSDILKQYNTFIDTANKKFVLEENKCGMNYKPLIIGVVCLIVVIILVITFYKRKKKNEKGNDEGTELVENEGNEKDKEKV